MSTGRITGLMPGSGVALVGDQSFALVGNASGSVIADLWSSIESGSDIDGLLDELSSAGLRTLGSFALARVEQDGIRIVVRGDATARLVAGDDRIAYDARGVRTWAEHFVEGASSFELQLANEAGGPGPYHLGRGVVPAGAIWWPYAAHEDDDAAGNAEPALTEPVAAEPTEAAPTEAEPTEAEPTEAEHAVDDEPIEREPVAPASTDEVDEDEVDEDAAEPALETSPSAGASTSGETIHLSRFDDSNQPEDAVDEPEPSPPDEPSDDGPSDDGPSDDGPSDDEGYDALYGRTIHRSVQQAAVEPEPEPDLSPEPAAAEPEPASNDASAPASAPAASLDAPAGLISGVPISGVPGGPTPAAGNPATPAPELAGDHDGLTISAAQLRALRAEAGTTAPPAAAPMGGPTVQAVLCRSGHPNPPHLSTCRTCHDVLDAAPQIIARPSMGRITLSTGEVIELTRPAIVGRNPKVEGRLPGEVPQTVRLDVGQALSRSHMMVRLEGWQVLVEDLGSANGTVVTLPGRPPQRLHAGEPILLEPGAEIDLGGEIIGTYQAGVLA